MTTSFDCAKCGRQTPAELALNIDGDRLCPVCAEGLSSGPASLRRFCNEVRSGRWLVVLGFLVMACAVGYVLVNIRDVSAGGLIAAGLGVGVSCALIVIGAMISLRRAILERLDGIENRMQKLERSAGDEDA
jgi:hypothetical protein